MKRKGEKEGKTNFLPGGLDEKKKKKKKRKFLITNRVFRQERRKNSR